MPRAVREIENVLIPLRDGCRLAARIWLPEDAADDPVPAILEYLPYRKRDGTAERDTLTHPYFAGHGYACVRVDMRGSGESDGVLLGEYLKQEQDDALEVLDWIAAQPWCTGAVGMIGISWGGFNGLQVAARRPPQLKAVVTLCSTDDRYADDVHFMGGCLLNDNLGWGSVMHGIMTAPPDPLLVGERWRAMWLERLENEPLLAEDWLRHQRRDEFWQHGSVCEDWGAIECPVYAVGGWVDGYSNAIPRLLAGLQGAAQGPDRPLGAQVPALRQARPGDRLPAGMPALVGPVAQGRRERRDGRADAARLDAGLGAAEALQPGAAGALGGGGCLAEPADRAGTVGPGAREVAPRYRRGGRAGDPLAARDRARRRPLVPLRRGGGPAAATSGRTTASRWSSTPSRSTRRSRSWARLSPRSRSRPTGRSRWWRCG